MIPHKFMIDEPTKAREGQQAALDALSALDYTSTRGVSLSGPTGRGKSYLAGVWSWKMYGNTLKYRVDFADWRELCEYARCRYLDGDDGDEARKAIKVAQQAHVLVLDDFGAGRVTDVIVDLADSLLDYRIQHDYLTVVTTNMGAEEMLAKFGDRVVSRLAGLCDDVAVGGKDWRLV
jgi:DNA replication protein DnaC